MLQKKLLFLTLNTFSSTGGIEKVCRIAGKAFSEIAAENGSTFEMFSMYDQQDQVIEKYVPGSCFTGFNGKRIKFIAASLTISRKSATVILSHVNLLTVGFLIKLISPKTQVVLIAHGIEVWTPFPNWKKQMLRKLDLILPVSEFTRQKMQTLYGTKKRATVVNNCLDPFLQLPPLGCNSNTVREKYGLKENETVLFTLTRLKSSEQYKGYDKVISALPKILEAFPTVRYLIAGKYDEAEKERLDHLIKKYGLEGRVIFTGYVDDDEIDGLFDASDLYIMPSSGEGFGIVFIEALFFGKPVIAGNIDGSVDALEKGRFGLLVDPTKQEEIVSAVASVLRNKSLYKPDPIKVQEKFGFETYKKNLNNALRITQRSGRQFDLSKN